MAEFLITAPDGKKYKITGATREGALAALKNKLNPQSNNQVQQQQPQPVNKAPEAPTGDTSMGTAFKVGDAQAQSLAQSGAASLQRNLSGGVFGDAQKYLTENVANPVRETFGFDPIDIDAVNQAETKRLEKAADLSAEAAQKLQDDLNFQNLTTGDIKDVGSFVNFVSQKTAQALPYMGAALASGGTLTYPFGVGEISQSLDEIEGLNQAQKDDIAATGGAIMAVLENLGIAKLLPNGVSTSIIGGISKGFVTEGTTEGLQELVVIGSEAVAGKKFEQREIVERLKEAVAAGGVVGSSIKASSNTATKVKSLFTGEGNLVDPDSIDADQKRAAASVAKIIRQTANQNGYNLSDVNASSSKGAKQALEATHENISEQIKQVAGNKVIKDLLSPKKAATLDQLIEDYTAAQVAIRQGKNKVKSKVTKENYDAIMRLLPDSAEKTQIANLLKMSNQVTDLFNNGLKGGISQYTDYFNPLATSGGVYDPTRIANIILGAGGAFQSGGTTLGIAAGGRVADAVTGRRSAVDRFTQKNENRPGLDAPSGTSLIQSQADAEAAAQQRADQEALLKDQRKAERKETNLKLAQVDAPPTKDSPQDTLEVATGLNRDNVARILRILKARTDTPPTLIKAIEGYEKSVGEGGKLPDLSPLIRAVRQFQRDNSSYSPLDFRPGDPDRVPLIGSQAPNRVNVDPTSPQQPQGGDEFGPQFTTPQNYNRGIEDNLQFNRELQDGATLDKSLSLVDRGRIITSLENLTNNLGSSPVPTVQTEIQKLQDAGVSQEAIDTYVKPYADRVIGQQRRNTPAQPDEPTRESSALIDRLTMDFKDVTERIPELQEGQQKLQNEEITKEEYADLVNKYKPVVPYKTTPEPATIDEATYALENGKGQSEKKAKLFGIPSAILKLGQRIQLRLDIPSYSQHGTWVVSIHEPNSRPDSTAEGRFKAGKVVGYETVARVNNAEFGMLQKSAQQIASGSAKGTIATILGDYQPMSPSEAKSYVDNVLPQTLEPGSGWAQVGMDPERHSYFYDRNTMGPIVSADEVVQIGPLVVAKNPVYASSDNFRYSQSGSPLLDAMQETLGSDLRISTRFPTQKASTEDPITEDLIVDTEAMKATPAAFEHNMDLVTEYVNFPTADVHNKDPDGIADAFKKHIISNLLYLHDQVPQEIRDRSKLWYDGARAITTRWADKYSLPDQAIAGALAALSPQKDWYQNVSLAERVLDVMTGKVDTMWTDTMSETAATIFGKPQYAEAVLDIQGKTLGQVMELQNDALTAMWVRTFDEAHNDRSYRTVSSEGNFIGKPGGKAAWGSLSEIGKSVAVIKDPSYENVTVQMGARHKVRNFYNNIISPNSDQGDVTIDTHAVAAGLLRPLSGNSTEVVHNFGTSLMKAKQPEGYRAAKASGIMGAQGLYGLYADAYREAAAQRGLKPREMQSITWEAIRGLFPAKWKQKKNIDAVNDIWTEYRNGDKKIDEARERVKELAGGINDPTWYDGPDSANDAEVSNSSYEGELDQPSVARDARGVDSGARRGSPRLSTGLSGVLSEADNNGPVQRSTPPSDAEVKQQYDLARAPLQINKPGTRFENGIKDLDGIKVLADAYGITLTAYKTPRAMAKDFNTKGSGPGLTGVYTPERNAAGYLSAGATRRDKTKVTPNQSFITALHEVTHGVAGTFLPDGTRATEDNITPLNTLNNRREPLRPGTLEAKISEFLELKDAEKNEIVKELIKLQDEVNFVFNDGEVQAVRDLAQVNSFYEKQKPISSPSWARKWRPLIAKHAKYVRGTYEISVDPALFYFFDPKEFKKVAPKTAKMMRDFFNSAGKVQFFSHPLAMGAAVVLAMLMKQEQAEEEEQRRRMMPPPGALNQPMQPGALSA